MNSENALVDAALLGDRLQAEKNYWSRKLAGAPLLIGIPADSTAPLNTTGKRSRVGIAIDETSTARLRQVCSDNQELVLTALITALKICLHKYTGTEDIIVGTPIHKRHGEIPSLSEALPLRTTVSDTKTTKQLLADVKETLFEAYAHQKYPYVGLLEILGAARSRRSEQLFKVGLVLEGISTNARLDSVENEIVISFALGKEALCGTIDYDADLYRPATIAVFAEHYSTVLRTMLDSPETRISGISLLSEQREQRLVYQFNSTQAAYPRDKTIHRLFEEQVKRTPGEIAVAFEDRVLTYRELDARANHLARHLREMGVGRGSFVGLYLEHSIETIVALLGVLKSGAAYVPFDPDHPQPTLEFMLKDSAVRVVLTQERLSHRLPRSQASIICLDSGFNPTENDSTDSTESPASSKDLAYIIYTSGSTGKPKGVEIRHSSLVNYIWWAREMYLRDDRLDCPLYSSLAFDLTVTMIYLPLITGNKIIVYRQDNDQKNPLARILEEDRVGILKLTPSHLSLIKEQEERFTQVKRVIVGGEALSTDLARRITENFGSDVEVFNEYGPTEATVGCMIHRFDKRSDDRAFVPIGRPAANTKIYVLDENLRTVPENAIGEIFIGGEGLARGYMNRPEISAERFVQNPFVPGLKMYRTGDLARWLPEGILEFVGRNDDQVKFHGHRVELNEIRVALNQHPRVRDSVVNLVRDDKGIDALVAYYASDSEIDFDDFRSFLSSRIIEATIPNFFARIGEIPLTVNGKVDYRALPDFDSIRQSLRPAHVAPRTPLETLIAEIWSDVLGVSGVGIHDNFFRLGGHSLIAARVIARLQSAFQLEIPMRLILDKPTVADLALAMTQMQVEQDADDDIADLLEEISHLTGDELEAVLAREGRA